MTEEQKQKLRHYEDLKIKEREIKNEIEMMKPELTSFIPVDAKIEGRYGTFTVKSRTKYKYSEQVENMEKQLKERKKEEEQTGVAEPTPGEPYVDFRLLAQD